MCTGVPKYGIWFTAEKAFPIKVDDITLYVLYQNVAIDVPENAYAPRGEVTRHHGEGPFGVV